jgi:putative hemolysin
MNDRPPERVRWSAKALRRIETNLAFALTSLMGLLWVLGEQSVRHATESAISPLPIATGTIVYGAAAVLLTIFLHGMLVASETAADLLKPMHLKLVRDERPAHAARLQHLFDRKPGYVAACTLAGQTIKLLLLVIAFLFAPGLATAMVAWFGWANHFGLLLFAGLLIALPLLFVNLIVGEVVPRSYAALHPHRVALRMYRFIRFVGFLFAVPSKVIVEVAGLLTARLGAQTSLTLANQAEEEIKNLVESAQESGEIETGERELLNSVFEFTDTVAREVMTPRVDLDAVPLDSDPREIVRLIHESGHSRIPLYEKTDDQIVGVVHAKDLLLAMVDNMPVDLRGLMRPALFVPENKNLHDVLAEMRVTRSHLAVVQDEFGGTAGIVTLEDVLEELVGEIVDEYDVEEPEVVETEDGYLVDGKTNLDDLNDEIGSEFTSEEFDTVGGYLFGHFGRQPQPNDVIELEGHRFTVVDTDGRRIHRVKVERLTEAELRDEVEAERGL